jgi:ABC-2 type transport system ATP-binding protein
MFEADELCDRVAVISKGQIVGEGTPNDLKARVPDRTVVEIEVFGVEERIVTAIRELNAVASVSVETRDQRQMLIVQSRDGDAVVGDVMAALGGSRIGRVTTREPTLEDAYVALISESGPE